MEGDQMLIQEPITLQHFQRSTLSLWFFKYIYQIKNQVGKTIVFVTIKLIRSIIKFYW